MNAELKSKIETYLKNSRATVGKEIIKALRTEYLEFQKTHDAIKLQYNSDCEKLKQAKEEVIELKKDIEGNKNEIAILRNAVNKFKKDNNSIEEKLKFYKIGFYFFLTTILLLGFYWLHNYLQ